MTQKRSTKVMLPMALVVLVPVDAPDIESEGMDLFDEPGYQYPSVCITCAETAAPYVAALSQKIVESKAADEATNRILSFAQEIAIEMPGARTEWTPWYGGVQFRKVD